MPKDVIQAVIWMGISYDEIQRMKDARVHWIKHTFPLIDRKITRQQCLEYYDKLKLERPVKSSCYFCPYKSNAQWKHHKENQPELWKKLVAFDEKIRDGLNTKKSIGRDGKPIKEAKIYVHGSCKPLKEVDFDKNPIKENLVLWMNVKVCVEYNRTIVEGPQVQENNLSFKTSRKIIKRRNRY